MITLPFHVDSPLATGVFAFVVCQVFFFLHWAYRRNVLRLGDGLGWFFEHKFRAVAPEKARKLGGHFLMAMAALFGCLALFGIAVGTGIVVNGDTPAPITMERFLPRS